MILYRNWLSFGANFMWPVNFTFTLALYIYISYRDITHWFLKGWNKCFNYFYLGGIKAEVITKDGSDCEVIQHRSCFVTVCASSLQHCTQIALVFSSVICWTSAVSNPPPKNKKKKKCFHFSFRLLEWCNINLVCSGSFN